MNTVASTWHDEFSGQVEAHENLIQDYPIAFVETGSEECGEVRGSCPNLNNPKVWRRL